MFPVTFMLSVISPVSDFSVIDISVAHESVVVCSFGQIVDCEVVDSSVSDSVVDSSVVDHSIVDCSVAEERNG